MDDGGDSMDFTPRMQQIYSACCPKRILYLSRPWLMTWASANGQSNGNSTGRPVPWLPTACNYSARKKPALNSSGRQTGKKN